MHKRLLRCCVIVCAFLARIAWAQEPSHVNLQSLTPVQVENLAVTGKVWGFLKYHHPAVTSGQRAWDAELLAKLPQVLAASDRAGADAVLDDWIRQLGPMADCNPCAVLNGGDYQLLPDLAWLSDGRSLSPALRDDLLDVYRHRSAAAKQFYVSPAPSIGNPVFTNEADYKGLAFPDAGYQLLSLFRFWNMVQYWAPYRDQIGEDWSDVLRQSIAPVALAKDRAAHELAMMAVIARIHDTHANLWSSLGVRPPVGRCRLPVVVRFVDGRAAVSALAQQEAGAASGLTPGDVIEVIDGVPVEELVRSWRPYYAASNEPTRLRDMAYGLTNGACGPAQLDIRRGDVVKQLTVERIKPRWKAVSTHDLPGDTFQLVGNDVAYLKLSSIRAADIPRYLERAAQTKGLIVDIRNYPSEFVPFALGQHLIDKPTRFVRFTVGDPANPGGFKWGPELELRPGPAALHYAGKVMILLDETSQSQAEYTAMALRVAPRAKVIGSTTAGADGNVSPVPLPGGLQSKISGIGVFYPDKRPTQRIGIVPDIEVKPTLAGLRDGRDEVLEAAIAEILR